MIDLDATKPDLKAVTKEDKELLAKMIRENAQLAKQAAELLIEREKLVLELIKQMNPANANLDRLLSEQEDLQRFVDNLQEEIKAMKEKLKK